MRRVPLRLLTVTMPGQIVPQDISYADIIKTMLFFSKPGSGLPTEDLLRSFEVWGSIKSASDAGKAEVLLEEVDWSALMARLSGFVWGPLAAAAPGECVELIDAIRKAERINMNKESAT